MGYESIDQYIKGSASIGATIGPYANRIANAQFELDGIIYSLDKNNGENTIHGGTDRKTVVNFTNHAFFNLPLEATPFDFRTFKAVGRDIGKDNILLKNAGGFYH